MAMQVLCIGMVPCILTCCFFFVHVSTVLVFRFGFYGAVPCFFVYFFNFVTVLVFFFVGGRGFFTVCIYILYMNRGPCTTSSFYCLVCCVYVYSVIFRAVMRLGCMNNRNACVFTESNVQFS